jgi:hypothetical protein
MAVIIDGKRYTSRLDQLTVKQLQAFLDNCPAAARVRFCNGRGTVEYGVFEMYQEKVKGGKVIISLEPEEDGNGKS